MIEDRNFFVSQIKLLHASGLSNRNIAKNLNVHHCSVGNYLRQIGLKPNGTTRSVREIVGNKQKCNRCKKWKEQNLFKKNSNYCRECRAKKLRSRYIRRNNEDIKVFWKTRFEEWVRKAYKNNIFWDLSLEYIIDVFKKQKGKCFYTGRDFYMKRGKGLLNNSLSIDKVVPEKGYVRGNIVFCTRRFNMIKNNMTLEEMQKWMPLMYEKLAKYGLVKE